MRPVVALFVVRVAFSRLERGASARVNGSRNQLGGCSLVEETVAVQFWHCCKSFCGLTRCSPMQMEHSRHKDADCSRRAGGQIVDLVLREDSLAALAVLVEPFEFPNGRHAVARTSLSQSAVRSSSGTWIWQWPLKRGSPEGQPSRK